MRFQNWVRDALKTTFDLHDDDIKCAVMGESGEDIRLSSAARRLAPISIECKNVEALNIWKAWAQAKENAGPYQPVVFFKRNHHEPLVAIDAEWFLELLKDAKYDETY